MSLLSRFGLAAAREVNFWRGRFEQAMSLCESGQAAQERSNTASFRYVAQETERKRRIRERLKRFLSEPLTPVACSHLASDIDAILDWQAEFEEAT